MGLRREKNRAQAIRQINVLRKTAEAAQMGALAWYRGLTAGEMYTLRVLAHQAGVMVKVARNRLARRALEGTHFACLQAALKGPVLLVFSEHGPKVVAQLLRSFTKGHDKFVVKYLVFEGELLPASDLDSMASLPTKEEALAHLLSALQAPIHKLLRVMSEPQLRLIRTLEVLRSHKND